MNVTAQTLKFPRVNTKNVSRHFDPTLYPVHLKYHLKWACPLTCGVLLFGLFSNLITIGVLQHKLFSRMRLTIYLVILCVVNIAFIFVQTLRVYSCNLDKYDTDANANSGASRTKRHTTCLWIAWFSLLLDYIIKCTFVCIAYNRFKAQGTADYTNTALEAKREPIVLITTISALCIIPSTVYKESKNAMHVSYPTIQTHKCSHLFVKPYDSDIENDYFIIGIHMSLIVATAVLLGAFFIRVVYNVRRNHTNKYYRRSSVAFSSMSSPETDKGSISTQITDDYDMDNPQETNQTISEGESTSYLLNKSERRSRRKAVTRMTVILAIGFVFTSSPRIYFNWPRTGSVKHDEGDRMVLLALALDILYMMFLSSNFFIFYMTSSMFGNIILRFYTEEPMTKHYTDLPLAARMNIVPKDSLEEKELFRVAQMSESNAKKDTKLSESSANTVNFVKMAGNPPTVTEFDAARDRYIIEDYIMSSDRLKLKHVTPSTTIRNHGRLQRKSTINPLYRGKQSVSGGRSGECSTLQL